MTQHTTTPTPPATPRGFTTLTSNSPSASTICKGFITVIITALLMVMLTALGGSPAHAADMDAGAVTIDITQEISSSGGSVPDGADFTYTLTPEGSCPLPATSDTLTLTGNTTGTFDPITFTTPGTYTYQVILTGTPAGSGYTPSSQSYTVTIHITETDNTLVAYQTIQQDGSKTPSIVFTHHWGAIPTDPALMVDPPVKKTVAGNPPVDATFTFTLTAKDPTNPMPEGSVGSVKTMRITGSGEKDFGTWSYTAPGIYYYTIKETNTGISGYAYDTTVYTITDHVNEKDGQLVLDRVTTNNAGKPVDAYTFINTYTPPTLPGTSGTGSTTGGNNGGTSSTGTRPGLSSPQTADHTNIAGLTTTIGMSALVTLTTLAYLIVTLRRKNTEE